VRVWFSGPRIFGGLVRPGISLGKEDFLPRLPKWRRHELRAALQAAAKARGGAISKDDADYLIDKALAAGVLDSAGGLQRQTRKAKSSMCWFRAGGTSLPL
jgi:hypothetical protein